LIDNPPPQPIAMQHFTAVEAAKKLEQQEYEPEIAMRHFAALAAAEKSHRASSSLQTPPLDETPIAMQHFAELDAKKKDAKSSMNASSKLSTIVVPDPVPIDYFNQLYAAERKAKLAESRCADTEVEVPIAIRHFTNASTTSTTSERSTGGNVPYEEMLAAYKHFNPPKTTKKKDGEGEVKTENLPIAIQRFTMAAYEEKQRLKAVAGSGGDGEGPSVAHLHFTPGLSLKQIITAE
jgi:hypothetical protein